MTPRLPGLRDQEGTAQMSAKNVKTKPAGILTKLVVLVLLVATATALLNLQSQLPQWDTNDILGWRVGATDSWLADLFVSGEGGGRRL